MDYKQKQNENKKIYSAYAGTDVGYGFSGLF